MHLLVEVPTSGAMFIMKVQMRFTLEACAITAMPMFQEEREEGEDVAKQ